MKVIKKELKYPCFCCNKSPRGKTSKKKNCPACGSAGNFTDEIYYHVVKGKNGKLYCFDGDTVK